MERTFAVVRQDDGRVTILSDVVPAIRARGIESGRFVIPSIDPETADVYAVQCTVTGSGITARREKMSGGWRQVLFCEKSEGKIVGFRETLSLRWESAKAPNPAVMATVRLPGGRKWRVVTKYPDASRKEGYKWLELSVFEKGHVEVDLGDNLTSLMSATASAFTMRGLSEHFEKDCSGTPGLIEVTMDAGLFKCYLEYNQDTCGHGKGLRWEWEEILFEYGGEKVVGPMKYVFSRKFPLE
jgi:hypothetical protein